MADMISTSTVIIPETALYGDAQRGEEQHLPEQYLEKEALFRKLRRQFDRDAQKSFAWRKLARKYYDMVASDQWPDDVRRELEAQGRPVITFNRILSVIRAVAGIEINGRHETTFIPRTSDIGDVKVNELLTQANSWMADGCDAEDEQSEAFQDALVCGIGVTEPIIAYDDDPDGKYVERKVDPLEVYWDCDATSKNIVDAQRVFRVRRMSLADARTLVRGFGFKVSDSELDAAWAANAGVESDDPKPVEDRRFRDENFSENQNDDDYVHIVHAQWFDRETCWRVAGFGEGETMVLSDREYRVFSERMRLLGLPVTASTMVRKVYKQAFLGASILGEVMPSPAGNAFTLKFITGERHRNKGTWFGLVHLMHDPQLWANKWLSQTLHILNTTAKGGIIAEEDAFADQREAEATYAQPDAITWAARDAIQKGKIMQKPGVGIPTAFVNLLEFAISSIRDVTGINLELLGMRDVNQPGILEAQRKQAALTILATMFDSLRRFRKEVGRVRLVYIQRYLSDGRLIRISSDEGYKLIPLLREKTTGQYDVIVDDAPTSPNQKEQTWGIILQILPIFREMITPEAAQVILEYSPLPSKVVEALKAIGDKPNPERDAMIEAEKQKRDAEILQFRSRAARDAAAASKDEMSRQLIEAQVGKTKTAAILDIANAAAASAGTQVDMANVDKIRAEIASLVDPLGIGSLDLLKQFSNGGDDSGYIVDPNASAMPGMTLPKLPTLPQQPPMTPQQAGIVPGTVQESPFPPMTPAVGQ